MYKRQDFASALGNQASAGFANSVAIGNGATTSRANQVALGTADNTYTLAGVNSAASTAAQSGPVGLVTTDQNGNIAADYSLSSGLTSNANLIARNQQDIQDNRAGIAAAFALDTAYVPVGKKFAINGGYGFYDSESAIGASAGYRLNDAWQIDAGVASGMNNGGTGGRVGFSAAW